jgi:hypothetical protein
MASAEDLIAKLDIPYSRGADRFTSITWRMPMRGTRQVLTAQAELSPPGGRETTGTTPANDSSSDDTHDADDARCGYNTNDRHNSLSYHHR